MGEGLRFEMLLDSFKHHDTLDVEHYNIDFAIACVQFFNIVVHSPENINLRVYLQYELYLLGLDDVLQKLKDRAGDRLVQHIEAYLDNRVDCSLLLEDAEAKESAVSKLERLEAELSSKISASREAARLEVESAFKARELELSELVESLRSRIRDLNIASWDRENIMKRRVEELQHALHASRSEVTRLQAALDSVKTSAVSEKVFASMATSTHFDVDANASVTNSNVIYETPHAIRKEPGRSASMDTESQSVQAAGSVDRAVRNRHEKHMAICTPLEKIKIGSDDRKLSSFKVCSSGPQKPVRKQNKFDSVDNPEEHPGCPNNTVIRRLAADAATTLSQLVNSTSVQGGNFGSHCLVPTPPYSIVPPSAWPYNPHSTIPVCDTLFGSDALQKSISIHPINMDLPSTNSSNLDEIWSRNWNNLSELWLSAVKYNDSVFSTAVDDSAPSSDQTSFSFQWLVDLQLLPSNVNEVYSAQDQSIQETISLHHWKLYRLLVRYAVPCLPAQRMLWQLRNEVHTHHSSGLQSYSWLLDKIEMSLTQQFGSTRQSDWRFHAAPENRWFWTSALLRISLIWQLFPMELQRVTEGLSTLLAGCTAILVNSKLPTVLQLAILFAQRVVADWTSDSFDLRHLDALVDWNLPSSASPAMNLHPPMNGGPPAYHSAPGDNTHPGSEHRSNSLVPGSFMTAFVQLVSQVAPSMMDWPADLGHVEPVLRVSIEDILMRIQDTKTALDVWRVIAPISSDLDTELEYVTHNHIQSVLQDTDQQIFRLVQSAEATRTVVKSTAYWLRISSSTVPSSRTDWLAPLVRFAAAFRRCAADMAKKRRNALAGIDNTSISNSPHRHEHRRGKNEKSHASHNDDKSEHRRRKHRTRQLDSDGIMDDILAGLTYQPLRTDIHTKRKESNGHKASS
ncbi:Formin protein 3 [Fasciola hepatica]|uniref:Formin protein 3 n=1 Tax=Fasciola hepatica TaxID=6192 RepID=A0A4E0S141_FASHE|nr:Formin protein 3 [Fasciola hepatica]